MNYIILTIEWCDEHGIKVPVRARRSLDGTKVILHAPYVNPVIYSKEDSDIKLYSFDSPELKDILDSEEWSMPIETGKELL